MLFIWFFYLSYFACNQCTPNETTGVQAHTRTDTHTHTHRFLLYKNFSVRLVIYLCLPFSHRSTSPRRNSWTLREFQKKAVSALRGQLVAYRGEKGEWKGCFEGIGRQIEIGTFSCNTNFDSDPSRQPYCKLVRSFR